MSDIGGIGPVGGAPGIPERGAAPIQPPQAGSSPADPVTLSPGAARALELLQALHDVPEMRLDRVSQLRDQIARAQYPTEANLHAAVDRLISEELR